MRCAKVLTLVMLSLVVSSVALADTGPAAVVQVTSRAASHSGRVSGERVTWTSTFVDSACVAACPSHEVRVALAAPIQARLDVARSPGVTPVVDAAGALVALVIDTDQLSGWRRDFQVVVSAPLARDASGGDVTLAPPLARGDAVQRVEVTGDGDVSFEPSPSLGLVHEVGEWRAAEIPEGVRRATDAQLGDHGVPLGAGPIYVEATSSAATRGLRGRVLTSAERARPGIVMAVAVFVILVALLGALHARLAREVRVEQAEAYLREEYEKSGG